MKTTGDIVRERYQRHIQSSEKVTRAVALFALQMACADLEEVWQDEYECLRSKLEGDIQTLKHVLRALDAANQDLLSQILALEAECISQRTTISELSARTIASMESCEPAAPNTSSAADPTPPALAASTTASADTAAPASSAPTSKPRRSAGRGTPKGVTGDGETGEEVGDTTGLDPTQPPSPHLDAARRLLANPAEIEMAVEFLQSDKIRWRDYPRPMRLALLAHLWQEQWVQMKEFERTRPAWMPTGGAVACITANNRWSEIVLSISELRRQPGAMK